jgi:DNA-binding NarL/FixJ family response regulator
MTKRSLKPAPQQTTFFNQPPRVRVLIVDDHELMREGLRMLIGHEKNLEICGEAATVLDAQKQLRRLQPDVVVVDLTLQDDSGLDLIKWIKQQQPATKIVVSTMHDERVYGERVLRAGANGYVNKQDPARTIIHAINSVLEGKLQFGQELVNRMLSRAMVNPEHQTGSPIDSLSDRELDVFRLLGHGLTVVAIAQKLHLTRSTVDTYRERLKTKLAVKTNEELVYRAIHWCHEEQAR